MFPKFFAHFMFLAGLFFILSGVNDENKLVLLSLAWNWVTIGFKFIGLSFVILSLIFIEKIKPAEKLAEKPLNIKKTNI